MEECGLWDGDWEERLRWGWASKDVAIRHRTTTHTHIYFLLFKTLHYRLSIIKYYLQHIFCEFITSVVPYFSKTLDKFNDLHIINGIIMLTE
jgi:hypothetical protein